jgi:hypothetical protein
MSWTSGFPRMKVVIKIESLSLDFKFRFKNKSKESFRYSSCNSDILL